MLDMRYDLTNEDGSNAHDIVNNSSELDLIQIFKKFGDERYSEQIAKAIIEERRGTIINTTGELKQLIRKAFQNKTDSK
jgi:16S rRNA (cytosine1402-N4)-methyltransferase